MKLNILLLLFITSSSFAQINDSVTVINSKTVVNKTKWYKSKVFKASIAPAILIGWGVSTIHGNGLYSSFDAYRDIHKLGFKRTHIDDYLIWVPYIELVTLNLLKIKCQNDFINTGILILKTELIMTAISFPVKYLTHIQRPDSVPPAQFESFPSGHTTQAFAAASIIHREFRYKSPWYGIGAYTIATAVAAFRMLNNRHWESDVFAGAGIGILSAHIAYLTHRYKWGRKGTCLIPSYGNGGFGIYFAAKF